MAQQTINVGAAPNDGTGTPLRTAFQYTNSNFSELYTAVGPSGNNIVVPGTATITGDLTVDTSTLKVDSTNNRVGIGTVSPGCSLEVYGSSTTESRISTITAGDVRLGMSLIGVSYNWIDSLRSSGSMVFGVGNAEVYRLASGGTATWSNGAGGTLMTLNSTGLGIGASPVERLTIGSTTAANYIKLTNSGAATGFLIGSFNTAVDIKNREVGAINFFTSDTQRMVISATGDVTVSTGNVVMGTSGKGIDFSATASGSGTMTSELLNDYEEGTWVGTITGSTTNPTVPVTATGKYTKIGRQVSVQIAFEVVSTVGASGDLGISGLPFANSSGIRTIGTAGAFLGATFSGTLITAISASGSSIDYQSVISNAAWSNATHNAGTGRFFWANVTYTV